MFGHDPFWCIAYLRYCPEANRSNNIVPRFNLSSFVSRLPSQCAALCDYVYPFTQSSSFDRPIHRLPKMVGGFQLAILRFYAVLGFVERVNEFGYE